MHARKYVGATLSRRRETRSGIENPARSMADYVLARAAEHVLYDAGEHR